MNDQDATTHDGHGLDTSEQRTGRRTDADACSLRHTQKGSRAEVLPDALGRSSKQREPPRNPAQKSYGARNRERSVRKQLGSTSSSPREIPSSSSASSLYRSRRSRSTLNAYLLNLPSRIFLVPNSLLSTSTVAHARRAGSHALVHRLRSGTVFFTTT